MSCIVGAIMYCTASIAIPGPLVTAPSNSSGAWAYVVSYSVPVVAQRTGTVPYVLPVPRAATTYDPAVIYGGRG